MVQGWLAVVVAVLSAILGYAAHVLQSRVPTKDNQDNQDNISDARRSEALEHFRWAAELAVANDQAPRRLGADQLKALVTNPHLEADDLKRVRAAIESALVPRVLPWEDDDPGSEEQRP